MKSLLFVSIIFVTASCGNFGRIQYRKCMTQPTPESIVLSEGPTTESSERIHLSSESDVNQFQEPEINPEIIEFQPENQAFVEKDQLILQQDGKNETRTFSQEEEASSKEHYPNYPKKRRRSRWSFTEVLFAAFVVIGITAGCATMLGLILFFTPLYPVSIFLMRYGSIVFLSSWVLGVIVTFFDPSLR